MNFFTILFQRPQQDFEWLLSSFAIQLTPFGDTSRSEAAIKSYSKILEFQLRRSLFLNLIKLNASNRHLLKMDSIRGFSRSIFYTTFYDLLDFTEHLF